MTALVMIAVLVLAFSNGANDNSKGVATLIGSGGLSGRAALRLAAVATLAGSVGAMLLAGVLVKKFSGKGIVAESLLSDPAFLASVGMGAAATVLAATQIGMPISTTHSLVGAIVGVGLVEGALDRAAAVRAFVVPLAVAPVIAMAVAAALYFVMRRVREWLGVTEASCVCIEPRTSAGELRPDGSVALQAVSLGIADSFDVHECRRRYAGHLWGIDAHAVLSGLHLLTATATSFARGLNDTPKIAALIIAAGAASAGGLDRAGLLVVVGVAIAAGGLLAVRRVAHTMSYRVTEMNDGQAFSANLVTALLVIFASRFGVPVSTTHVSCGSLFGIGAVSGQAHWRVIGQIALAWVTTLPVAAGLGMVCWWMLKAIR